MSRLFLDALRKKGDSAGRRVFDQCAAVIYASHATRARYASLQTEQHASDTLDSEYEKLLLEQSVWAGYNRVDQLARETLQMRSPDQTNLLVVRPAAEPLSRDEAL